MKKQTHNRKGILYIISAPSGAGKTSMSVRILETLPDITQSVSYTTRQKRAGETDEIDYSFVDEKVFKEMIERNEFLEWANVHGNYYGTSQKRINQILESGSDVLLDIDTQGAKQIQAKNLDAVYIFIFPPSVKELKARLVKRGTDDIEVIERRVNKAILEMKNYHFYNYMIVNDELEKAIKQFQTIIEANRLSTKGFDPLWVETTFFQE